MPIDDLPGELTVTTRDKERDRFLRDYSFHKPGDVTSPGTEPYIQASTVADIVMPLYHDIKVIADATDPQKITGKELVKRAEVDGVFQLQPVGASGSVKIRAAVGGGTIFAGDEIIALGLRFQCNQTQLYQDEAEVPIIGRDVGIVTNLPPGTVMTWNPARPGIADKATVVEQVDGAGLSGGRDLETFDDYRDRWNREKAARAASGNDTEIQEKAENTFGVAVEKAFTYPAILSPGTTCIAFTLKPSTSGASRIPNSTQRDAVLANVVGSMPRDEGIFGTTIVAEPVDLVFRVRWDDASPDWADLQPWPVYFAPAGQAVIVQSAADAAHFVLKAFNNSYVGIVNPVAGQTIAVYDLAQATFRRKRILSVTGTGPWTIVADTTNSASDETYIPIAGQRAMPWSDSLQSIVKPLQEYFHTLGPGEQVAVFFDAGVRQRRQPQSPKHYPSVITTKGLENALDIDSIFDVTISEPTLPRATTVGTPATISNLLEINRVAAFPL